MHVWHSNTVDATVFTLTICNTSMVHGLYHCGAMRMEPVQGFKLRRFDLRGQNCGWWFIQQQIIYTTTSLGVSRQQSFWLPSHCQTSPTVKVTVTIKTSSTFSITVSMDHSSRLPQLSTWCISRLLYVTLTLTALRIATVLFIWHKQYHCIYHHQTCQSRSQSPIL
jgi:hypothetical protein